MRIRQLCRIKKNILDEIPGFNGLVYWGVSGGPAFVSEKGGVWMVTELHMKNLPVSKRELQKEWRETFDKGMQ